MATYEDLVTVVDRCVVPNEDQPKDANRQERRQQLQAEFSGRPAAEVKAHFERLGYECSTFRPANGPIRDFLTGSLTTGILCLDLPWDDIPKDVIIRTDSTIPGRLPMDELVWKTLSPKETILLQYDHGVITQVALP